MATRVYQDLRCACGHAKTIELGASKRKDETRPQAIEREKKCPKCDSAMTPWRSGTMTETA